MTSLLYLPGCSLPSLLLFLLIGVFGAQGEEEFQVLQPKDPISVAEGETVTLNCTVLGIPPPGPVIWFKGKGPQRQEIFNFKGGAHPHIKKAGPLSSNTDFSISISHTTPEDSGTYYCVKFRRGNTNTELKSGRGTMFSVTAKPSTPVVLGPQERVNVERMEYFSCNSVGFSPKAITLKWFKNGNEIHPLWTKILPEDDSISYNITSTVQVKLEASDVHSEVICEVNHNTLSSPLQGTKNLSDVIRGKINIKDLINTEDEFYFNKVRPKVNISSQLLAMNVRNITCHVAKFYPQTVSVIWLENGIEIGKGKTLGPTENKDGTYSLNTSLMVNVSGQKEDQREITCQVLHDFQTLITLSKTFEAPFLTKTVDQKISGQGVSGQLFVIFLLGLKALLLFSISWLYALRKQKIKVSEAVLSVPYSSAPAP